MEGQPLTASKVFTGLALFNQLTVPLYIIPLVIPMLISAIISTKRLAQFLSLPEVDCNLPWRNNSELHHRHSNNCVIYRRESKANAIYVSLNHFINYNLVANKFLILNIRRIQLMIRQNIIFYFEK